MQTNNPLNFTLKMFRNLNFVKCPPGSDRAARAVKNEYNERISRRHTLGDIEESNVARIGWRGSSNGKWIRIHSLCDMMWKFREDK